MVLAICLVVVVLYIALIASTLAEIRMNLWAIGVRIELIIIDAIVLHWQRLLIRLRLLCV